MSLVEVEFFGKVEGGVGEEVFHIAAVLLGGTAQTGGALDESADAVHLKQIILVLGSDVLHHVGHELGADAVFDALKYAERIGYRRLADLDDIALVYHLGRFHLDVVHSDAALLAGLGRNGAGLENTNGPEPLVNTSLSHNL